mgnify:CR=1 FL=1
MDNILFGMGALAVALGLLFIPRTARGEVEVIRMSDLPLEPPVGSSPLGLRNNNPFNLEFRNIGWIGEVGTDGRFSVFDTAENGIRAGMINIHTKMNRDGANTVRKLLTLLSPAFENPLEAIIQFTASKLNVAPDQPIQFGIRIIQLSQAIIQFENGQQPFTFDELESALARTGRL